MPLLVFVQVAMFLLSEVFRLDAISRFFNSAFAPPVFGALVGVGATAYMTSVVQARLMRLGREQQDRADAWDNLLTPLTKAVRDCRWDLSHTQGFSRSWAYAQRESAVEKVNDLFRDKSSHRLARFLVREIAAINDWLMCEFMVASHWSQALSQRGPAGQLLFALLVEDTSMRVRPLSEHETRSLLATVGYSAPPYTLLEDAVRGCDNPELWEEARRAAEEHLAMAREAQLKWSALRLLLEESLAGQQLAQRT